MAEHIQKPAASHLTAFFSCVFLPARGSQSRNRSGNARNKIKKNAATPIGIAAFFLSEQHYDYVGAFFISSELGWGAVALKLMLGRSVPARDS